jgi:murein DD-endopeptidase MepM/ murein hydrolase activator NlpD
LKGKKAALGYDYSNDISKMTTQLEEIKARLVTMPGGEKILDPETGAVLDYTYVKSALRGRRALGFLDPELFITSYTFPISGKKIEITTSTTAPAPATTPAPSTTQTTTFTKQMPVPISVSKISSSYGDQEDFRKRPHRGIDILVHNQAVVAPISGHILAVNLDPREKSGAGIYVRMLGDDGFVHDMFHLSSVSGVKFGQAVPCGAQLGISGNTGAVHKHGASEGYHLHWGVWKWEGSTPDWTGKPIKVTRPDGSEVNPVWWLGSDSVIDATNRIPNQVSTLPSSLDQSTIDWEEEVKGMEQWKKNCLVGWANGIPDPTIDTSAIDFSSFAPTDCLSLASDRKRAYLTHSEVTIIGRNSGFLGQYSPHGQNVAIVLRAPKQGWGYNYGATDDWQIQGASFQANTHTRAQILIELLEKVDYYWWVSGNGDVIFDFPNYEMIPDHYGSKFKNEFEFYGLGVNDTILEDVASLKSTYIFRGNIGFAGARPGELEAISRIYPAIYKLPSVAARNGIEVEEHFWPYITSQEQLKILGALHIRKAIANAFKYTLSGLPPMLYVTPNTPVHLGDIDAYGLVNSTSFHYNAQGNISTDLQFTAIRQRLTEEQLYLKLQSKQSDKVEIEGMAEFLSAWKLKPQLAKNTSEELLNSLQRTAALYGYIFGSGELLIDYTKTYSQNIKLAGGYTVSPSDDRGAYPTGTGGNVTTFQDNPKAPRLISTPEIKVGQAAPETSSDLFITAVAPQPEQLQALKESLVDLSPEDLVPAIVAHGNVTTGLQDRWTMPSFSDVKDLLSKGVGFLNLTSKVLGQVDKTVSGFAQIGNRVTNIANAGFDATASLAAAGKSLQSVMARSHVVDPRMDPVFSSQCAAVISRQVLTHVNKAYDKPLTPAEVHPDIFAYALHLGPKDPALLQILAEHDLRDRSDANTAAIGRALQARMWKMGGYTKRDLDYVDAFQNMKKQAAKRGLHN